MSSTSAADTEPVFGGSEAVTNGLHPARPLSLGLLVRDPQTERALPPVLAPRALLPVRSGAAPRPGTHRPRRLRCLDLITWQELPEAFAPVAEGLWDDRANWTGSIIVHQNRYYWFYTVWFYTVINQ